MLPFQSNLTLLSAADRQTLQRLVDIFLSQGLTFLQTRQEEGHYDYVLEPYVSPWLALAPGPGVATDDLVSPPTVQAGPTDCAVLSANALIGGSIWSSVSRACRASRSWRSRTPRAS